MLLQSVLSATTIQLMVMALALLVPMLLLFSLLPRGIVRLEVSALLLLLAFGVQMLSYALAAGPSAWGLGGLAWLNTALLQSLALALLGALVFLRASTLTIFAALLLLIPCAVWLASALPSNPFLEATQSRWEQGRFVHFYGLSLWVNQLWLLLVWLYAMWRLSLALLRRPRKNLTAL